MMAAPLDDIKKLRWAAFCVAPWKRVRSGDTQRDLALGTAQYFDLVPVRCLLGMVAEETSGNGGLYRAEAMHTGMLNASYKF